MRRFYTLVLYLALPLVLLRLWWRGRRQPGYRERWGERLGRVSVAEPGVVWFHAVSVGEVMAAAPLIRALRSENPALPILVSTSTPTGAERVRSLFGAGVVHAYAPYDLPMAVGRYLERLNPRLLVLVETEIWPNLIAAANGRGIPVVLANGRLSARSAGRYRCFRRLLGPVFRQLAWVGAQGPADARRFLDLGVGEARLTVTGNLKSDVEVIGAMRASARERRAVLGSGPVWIGASTHEGEETLLLAVHEHIRRRFSGAVLVLVPRHPDRFGAVWKSIRARGLPACRRTDERGSEQAAVYLVDAMGELPVWYGAADLAFIGGSLVRHGGQNPLEAAVWGIPLLAGPHVFNFERICQELVEAGGLQKVGDAVALESALSDWFADPASRRRAGEAARSVVAAGRGATGRTLAGLRRFLQ